MDNLASTRSGQAKPRQPVRRTAPFPWRAFQLAAICWLCLTPVWALADEVDFGRDVLPLLADRCFQCHGPDANHREADLRLDQPESLRQQRGEHSLIMPEQPDKSLLLQRISSQDPELRMPPPDSNRKPLTPAEVDVLRRWIAAGATWKQHWAFVAPVRPKVPKLADHPIDAFILERLGQIGLQLNPEASQRELIRRVSLDLTGLPPTMTEVEAYLDDTSPFAYERLVDRLLSSPRYGERMAWPWLEAARFADTSGYQGDPERTMWPWRDWVVHALNSNMPFDQFTVEQLAGDLLSESTPQQRLATAFHRNHMHNSEGGRIAEETRVENVFDRLETTGTVWLGLTFQCARCHDHKFDPLKNSEYYAFFDFFNQTSEDGRGNRGVAVPPAISFVPPAVQQELLAVETKLSAQLQKLRRESAEWDAAQQDWESHWREQLRSRWRTLHPLASRSLRGATIEKRADGSLHVTGTRPEQDVYEIVAPLDASVVTSLRLEALVDPESPGQGTGRDEKGNFVLSEFELFLQPNPEQPEELNSVRLGQAQADFAQGNYLPEKAIDGKLDAQGGWAVAGHVNKVPRTAEFHLAEPLRIPPGARLVIRLHFVSTHTHHTLALFRLSIRERASKEHLPAKLEQLVLKEPSARSSEEQLTLRDYYRRRHIPALDNVSDRIRDLEARRKSLTRQAKPVQVMVMDTRKAPRATFVLTKGLYNQPTQQQVVADTPAMLPRLAQRGTQRPTRLDLARWLVSRENPLTARVTVNRYWQMYFGQGIVTTPGDFGLQGARPSHPELLDWLAVEFIESGWDVKHLQKLIVTSQTYRQSAVITQRKLAEDPNNTWLSRSPRLRLPSWMLRDQALMISGLLNPQSGGPPVKPYQPGGLWAEATFGKKKYEVDTGDNLYRRSLYTYWRRIIGPPLFFDAAKRQTCEVSPSRTNTPLHALTTLNDVTYVEAARMLAQRVLQQAESTEDRLDVSYQWLTTRAAEPREIDLLTRRLREYRNYFAIHPDAARALLASGAAPRDSSLDLAEHAAWTAICNTLLNLDEVLVKP